MEKNLEIKRFTTSLIIFISLSLISFLTNKYFLKIFAFQDFKTLNQFQMVLLIVLIVLLLANSLALIIFIKDLVNKYKFKRETGEVMKAWVTEKIKDPSNKFTKMVIIYTYHLKIAYKDGNNLENSFDVKVPKEMFMRLRMLKDVPLRLYKDKVIIDEKRLCK